MTQLNRRGVVVQTLWDTESSERQDVNVTKYPNLRTGQFLPQIANPHPS